MPSAYKQATYVVCTNDVKVMNNEITLAVSVDECATIVVSSCRPDMVRWVWVSLYNHR